MRQLEPIGEILYAALKRRGMAVKREESAVFKLWPQATGPQIALQTKPDGWRAGILFVRAASSVWVQQLHFMKEEIRQKLNSLAGKAVVRDIHFTVGYFPAVPDGKKAAPFGKAALKERDKRMINECAGRLADPELADVVKRVMTLEISRRRQLEERRPRRSK
ncbi:MAG: DUF721 domain-containing protein [Smithellaceae bacterium]|nr:DUF721 domain-containing protein [Syntrophaceae bacterium]MDD4240947.1 DUF721 domain-containing protein [Smithellaceae bacterium]NLX51108.1 DUF721 domain-containing protein [Deltaproteobacteria bacterium]